MDGDEATQELVTGREVYWNWNTAGYPWRDVSTTKVTPLTRNPSFYRNLNGVLRQDSTIATIIRARREILYKSER